MRAFTSREVALEQAGRVHSGLAGIRVGILAIADEAIGEGGHLGREIRVEVKDTENGHLGDGADALEDFAFHIEDRLGGHRAMQHEVDGIEMVFPDERQQLLPELVDHLVGHGGRGLRPVVH